MEEEKKSKVYNISACLRRRKEKEEDYESEGSERLYELYDTEFSGNKVEL